MAVKVSPSALRALALHLEMVSKNVRSHGGHGWTYDEEVKELNLAAEELEAFQKREHAELNPKGRLGYVLIFEMERPCLPSIYEQLDLIKPFGDAGRRIFETVNFYKSSVVLVTGKTSAGPWVKIHKPSHELPFPHLHEGGTPEKVLELLGYKFDPARVVHTGFHNVAKNYPNVLAADLKVYLLPKVDAPPTPEN